MSEQDHDLTPEKIADGLDELKSLQEQFEALQEDLPDMDDLEPFDPEEVQGLVEAQTRGYLEHLTDEECDSDGCQHIREAFGLSPGEDADADTEEPEESDESESAEAESDDGDDAEDAEEAEADADTDADEGDNGGWPEGWNT